MFFNLIINTGVSALAFFIVSLVGLLLVPFLISNYGLEIFGIITLLRLMLPTGLLAFFDLGFSEITTLSVARARVDNNWGRCESVIGMLLVLSLLIACLLCGLVYASSDFLSNFLNVNPEYAQEFIAAIKITGVTLLLIFPALIFEGVVKGYEKYRYLRASEVFTTLFYAGSVIYFVNYDVDFVVVHYLLLISLVIRGLSYSFLSLYLLNRQVNFNWRICFDQYKDTFERCRLFGCGKILGVAQVQLSPFIIGVLFSPAAIGLYDVLVRLSRFAKSVLGLLSSTILPFAAKLDAANDNKNLAKLGNEGFLIIGWLIIPPIAWAISFSEPILLLWIGSEFGIFWVWQSITFFIPLLNVFVSFGASALMGRKEIVRKMNFIIFIQIIVQFLIGFILLKPYYEKGFILGQVIATVLTFFLQFRIIFIEKRLDIELIFKLIRIALISFSLVGLMLSFDIPNLIDKIDILVFSFLIWNLILYLLFHFIIFSKEQRVIFYSFFIRLKKANK
jgi:O-antigen/teichoic acid export membrane protein